MRAACRVGIRAAVAGVVAGTVLAAATSFAQAPARALSVPLIYDPAVREDFSGTPPTSLTWIDDDSYLWTRPSDRGHEWVKVEAVSGRTTPLFDAARMEAALAALPGIERDEAGALARSNGLRLNPARSGALLTIADDLYVYDFRSARATRLTTTPGDEEEATFSPDGRLVAFVRSSNLFVVDVATAREQALTTDGSPEILNGKLDWLYQEEVYGRGRFRGYWWSPDSSRIAFLQLNEGGVPEHTVVDHIPYRPTLEVTNYPNAGDRNPTVRLGIARTVGGAPIWTDLERYSAIDILMVNVDWTPDSTAVVCQVQDREQTWLDLNLVPAGTGRPRRILRETTKAWVNENGNPTWLKNGSFLWFSERSGFRHLYQYTPEGTQLRQVTSGRWDVRTLYGVDEAAHALYFAAGERSVITTDIYRVAFDSAAPGGTAPGSAALGNTAPGNTALTRLSQAEGTHRATFNPGFSRYIDVWSDVRTPSQVRLHRADGRELRVIDANPVAALAQYRLSTPEFLHVTARDGFVMDAMMIKPADFTPTRRYPVYQFTYAGPGAASVRNRWGGTEYMYHQLLAQSGVIVWILDNRSAGGKGVEAQWPVYGRLGELELQDLEDGAAWLSRQPYVDPSRLVLHGWSYGGFMTAYALTHSTTWSAGIAGAPVTDWRDYDSVYTERYMKLPQNNPDGYRRTAPRFAAGQLRARLLLIHGTMDDNVHMQNSVQFAYELQKAGKPFDVMIYPKSRHGFSDPALIAHLRQTMYDFVMRSVAPSGDTLGAASLDGARSGR